MKILYFAPIYYSDMKQRPQQIAELLSKEHEVYYIEPTISLVRQVLKGGVSCGGEKIKVNNNLTVIRLNGCFTFHKSIEILDILGINNFWEIFQLKRLIEECDIVWVGYSGWYTVVRHIRNKPVIFDKMDEEDMIISSKLLKKTLRRNKRKMVELSQAIVVTCRKFYDDLSGCGKPVYLVPNGVSDSFMEKVLKDSAEYGNIEQVKTIGYIGTISEWFDMSVIDKILETNKNIEIILVGRNYLPEKQDSRVKYLGIKKNEELPEIIQQFDICLYNFKKSELLDTINPVKIYEYLAANKPVLAVKSAETMQLAKYLMIYDSKEEIGEILSHRMERPFKDEAERKAFITENSWKSRVERINTILHSLEEK